MKPISPNSMRQTILATAITSLLALVGTAQAVDRDWDAGGGVGDTDFNTAANWTSDTVPVGGDNAFINGTATITGNIPASGALNIFEVGRWGGTGLLTQTAGLVSTASFNIGLYGTGTYNLNGIGSITMTADLLLGHGNGNGTLNINTSGTFASNYVNIGNTSWGPETPTGALYLDAGTITSTYGFGIGGAGGNGTMNVTGGTINSGGNMLVGTSGTGTYTQSGGTVSVTGQVHVSDNTTAVGVLNVSGGTLGSTNDIWASSANGATGQINVSGGTVNVGNYLVATRWSGGSGIIGITSGTVNTTGNAVGISEGGSGATAVINVSGGALNSNDVWVAEAYAGGGGTGTLNISGSGVVNPTWWVWITKNASATGVVNLDGGTLATTHVIKGDGSATLNFNGGTLKAKGSDGNFIEGAVNVMVKAGGALIDTNGNDITIQNNLLEDGVSTGGGLTKSGAGKLTLAGVNTYTGLNTVSVGTLETSSGATLGTGSVTLASGATLTLGSTVSFGNNAILTFASTSAININFSGNDVLYAITDGSLTIGQGAYTAANLNSFFGGSNFVDGGNGGTLQVVPEPGTFAMLLAGVGMLTMFRRRRA
jgi:hypothetical protein